MDEYRDKDQYYEVPIPTGDGWHRPEDQPENGRQGQQPGDSGQYNGWQQEPRRDGQQNGPQGSWQQNGPQGGWQQNGPQGGWQQNGPQGGWQQNGPQGGWQQGPYPPYPERPPKQQNRLAVWAMVCAILALVTCCCSPLIQFPLAVTAIVLVILSKRGRSFNGYSVAALIMAIIAIILSIIMTYLIGVMRSPEYQEILNSPEFQEFYEEYESIYESMYDAIPGGQNQ